MALAVAGCGGDGGGASDDAGTGGETGTPDPGMLPPRPSERSCIVDGTPPGALPRVEFVEVFPNLGLGDPVGLVPAEMGWLIAADRSGSVVRLSSDGDGGDATQVLDLSARLGPTQTEGLLSLVLHPDYAQNGWMFVHYVEDGPLRRSVVARFTVTAGVADPGSELSVLQVEQPEPDRNGGALAFGPDGLLYIGIGDGGEPDGPQRAQELGDRHGSLLRVGVDMLDTQGMTIPPDNPFVDAGLGSEREVWAYGLRDPWRCAVDSLDGQVYCGDQGEAREEVDIVERGANLGWPILEGDLCRDLITACDDDMFSSPAVSYGHEDEECGVVAGIVYRGDGYPELEGAFVYGDRCSGRVWGLHPQTVKQSPLGRAPDGVLAFGQDHAGELHALGAGRVWRIEVPESQRAGLFPESLSQTGCFTDLRALTPAPDLYPYDINAPLWTDGAVKDRFIALPPGETIAANDDGTWAFPEGAIVVKVFSVEFEVGNAATRRPVETRFMIKRDEGWDFHTYRWNDEATDGVLLQDWEVVDHQIVEDGVTKTVPYLFPDRFSCQVCHGTKIGLALGPRTEQFDRIADFGGGPIDQLDAWTQLGLLEGPTAMPPYPDPADEELDFEVRARAYLHGNCAHCHRPGGWTPPDLEMDLRFSTPLADTNTCGERRKYANPWAPGTILIDPGDPDNSYMLQRMRLRGDGQMPLLGTFVVDPTGEDVMRQWIEQLAGCP